MKERKKNFFFDFAHTHSLLRQEILHLRLCEQRQNPPMEIMLTVGEEASSERNHYDSAFKASTEQIEFRGGEKERKKSRFKDFRAKFGDAKSEI